MRFRADLNKDIATATSLPVLTYNSPWRNGEGVEFTADLTQRLIDRLPNYIGMKDADRKSTRLNSSH